MNPIEYSPEYGIRLNKSNRIQPYPFSFIGILTGAKGLSEWILL